MFEEFKSYFLSIEKCTAMLKNFFGNTQCELFFDTIKSVENSDIPIVEDLKLKIMSIHLKINSQNTNSCMTTKEIKLLNNLRDESIPTQNTYNNYRKTFFDTCPEYITEWTNPTLKQFDGISWITLKNIENDLTWPNISNTIKLIKTVIPNQYLNEAGLFDEYTILKNILQKNENIKFINVLDEKWAYIFKAVDGCFPNLKIIVEFLICIPGSNANVERIFSNMNNL